MYVYLIMRLPDPAAVTTSGKRVVFEAAPDYFILRVAITIPTASAHAPRAGINPNPGADCADVAGGVAEPAGWMSAAKASRATRPTDWRYDYGTN